MSTLPAFDVRLLDAGGAAQSVRVHAVDERSVPEALHVTPGRVLSVRPVVAERSRRPRQRLQTRLFAQELSVLLGAGIPLLEALRTLNERDGSGGPLDAVIVSVSEGRALSDALAAAWQHFDPLFVAMVASSERHGQLACTLRDHAAYLQWSEALRARLVAAAVYPAALLGAGGAVVLFLLLYVLPRFAGVFAELQAELPWASRALMAFGVAAAEHRPLVLGLAALGVAGIVAALRSPTSRDALAALAWRVPALARQLRSIALARLYRTLGVLLAAGVPVVPALRLAEGALAAPLRPALARSRAAVDAGARLSQALHDEQLATAVAWRMLKVGEGSGQVATMFERAAAFHDEELARLSELLTRAVNPVLMLVMGVVIGGIVVLMYLPIFTLMEQVG